jgi:TolB protein
MLLRVYRLTDKFGLVLLKLGAASVDWMLDGASALANLTGGSLARVFSLLVALLMLIASFLWTILKFIGRIFGFIFGRFGGATGRAVQSGARAGGAAVNDAMARRAARDEIDVVIKEDPLRVQNRRLSVLVLVLGVLVVAALLYATDPNRFNQAVPIAVVPDNNDEPVATVENSNNSVVEQSSTIVPTAAPLPEALRARGAIAYTVRERGQSDIWVLPVGSGSPLRIINNTEDDRDPEWSPSGTQLAYASRNGGNWDIYIYDTIMQGSSPLTIDLSFQANPTWSPDGVFIAYENYFNDNLEIYAQPIDGSQPATNLTENPAPDFSPAWSPDGRRVAFVSLRDGNQEIYVLNLSDTSLINISNTPTLDEDNPVWSPDGNSIAYSVWEQGIERVNIASAEGNQAPQFIAAGHHPTWSPDGSSIAFAVDSVDGSRTDFMAITVGAGNLPILISSVAAGSVAPSWTEQPLPPQLVNSGGLDIAVENLFIESTDTFDGNGFDMQSLANVQTNSALLSDAVDDSFNALRQRVFDNSGTTFLNLLDDAFWGLERVADAGEPGRNWLRTGRAFAIPRNSILGFPPEIEIVREDRGAETYWRIFVRVDDAFQRGQLGEPLRRLPWDFLAATSGNVDAYEQGGTYRSTVQPGYYIDFTQIAADYGWERVAASSDWRANTRGRNYWLFINDGGLTWCQAMLQQYSEGELINYGCTN